jgi:adenylate cyclase
MEIERKFLVSGEPWRDRGSGTKMRQGYLAVQRNAIVRVRVTDAAAWLTVKGPTRGISREEIEVPVSLDRGHALLELCEGAVVEKTRYRLPIGPHVWEIDVFSGDNDGLVVAEIELAREDEVFERPDWLLEEVSAEPRYTNASLSRAPYSGWST